MRWLTLFMLLLSGSRLAAGAAEAQQATPEPPAAVFGERVEVALAQVAVRVLGRRGEAVRGLEAGDFRVRVGRREVPVVGLEWVEEQGGESPGEPPLLGVEVAPAAPRLVVFFVQTDAHPTRMRGQMRLRPHLERFVASLAPSDRAAVVSFDSHLKLRADFATEREVLLDALFAATLFGREPPWPRSAEPALARHLDRYAALDAATPERALELVGRALAELPGEKVVVYVGYGLGRLGLAGVEMTPAYARARAALELARATVFVLDVTDADYHSLEVGLEQVAADTGGTYIKTHIFPAAGTTRIGRALAGHYLLSLRRADAPPGERLRVDVRGEIEGEVHAPPTVPPPAISSRR